MIFSNEPNDNTLSTMEEITSESDIILKINAHIEEFFISESKLAAKLGITPNHLYRVLKGKGTSHAPLSENLRQKMNELLKTNY